MPKPAKASYANPTPKPHAENMDMTVQGACANLSFFHSLHFNLIGGTQSFVVLILSAVVGRFLDAGYQKTLICVGTFLVALGSFTLSLSNGKGDWNEGNYHLTWLTQGE